MGRPQVVDIKPPIRGVSDDMAFMDQAPLTTREALNCRGLDPLTGRRRISKRSGLKKYVDPDATMNGSNKVADLIGITKDEDLLTYADDDSGTINAGPSNVFSKALPGTRGTSISSEFEGDCVDLRMDDFGDLYAAQRVSGVFKFNPDGELLAELLIPEGEAAARVEISCIDVDEFGNVLVGTGGNSINVADCRLYFFENRIDGTYRLAWTLDTGRLFMDVGFHQGTIYTLEADELVGAFAGGTSTFRVYPNYTTLTAPVEDTTKTVDISAAAVIEDVSASNVFGTRMAIRDDGIAYVAAMDNITSSATAGDTYLFKLNPGGDTPAVHVWGIASQPDNGSGMGMGVAVGPRDSQGRVTVYSYGPRGTAATDNGEGRRIRDTGTGFSLVGTDTWAASLITPVVSPNSRKFTRLATDADGHLYAPNVAATAAGDLVIIQILKASDGSALGSFKDESGETITAGSIAVAVSQEAKPKGSTAEETEFVFFGTRESVTTFLALHKQRMLKVTVGTGSMRSLLKLGVSGGNIVKFTSSAFADPAGGTGVAALDSGVPFVMSTALGLFVYWTDGKQYKRYSVEDDAVSEWLSETSGTIPQRCKIMETWRARVMLGRDPEDPQLWHSSAVGLANDWDNFPPVASLTQAISGVNAKAGRVPDIVNAIIPWDDDLCLFGGDQSIWRLTGDPLAGGQFDQVSLETGIAFGRAWTLDPIGGRLFFFGSRGGVYMMTRGSLPVRISRDRIERRLQDVDLSTTYIRMVWNYRDEGLHIFQLPFGGGGTVLDHWFWDAKQDKFLGPEGAWWPDRFGKTGSTDVQPTAVYLFDGDTQSDRKILMGGEDGRVRVWDENTASDEGPSADLPIQFECTYGPIMPSNEGRDYFFSRLTAVLADDQNGCGYRVYTADQADNLGLAVARGSFHPGRNNGEAARFRGPNAWVSLSNTHAGQRCSVEDLQVSVARRGRVRRR